MFAPVLLLLVPGLGQPKLTFADVERSKHTAYRMLGDFRDRLTVSVQDGDDPAESMEIEQRIAKANLRVVVRIGGKVVLEGGYDGASNWLVAHLDKAYQTTKGPHQWFREPYQAAAYASSEPQFDMSFKNGYGVRFDCNPPLVVQSDQSVKLDGADARLIVAKTSVPGSTRSMEVRQWFFPDRFILRRFEVNGVRKDGKKLKIVGAFTEANFKANLTPKDFALPPVPGYTQRG
ncbi:MAG: hypothetical protein KIS66_01525 [Fimbriimonadaceae bacterium]|nr:hypothetical protein [Fimbriimonadaceae bacterium]